MNDTIVACSTPQGKGAIAVVRMSGMRAGEILAGVLDIKIGDPRKSPRKLCRRWLVDENKNKLDEVLVVFFPAPNTYTGEEMVEIHCHGGEGIVEVVMEEMLKAGARPAKKGEFTRRSFESGKMDLSKAEGVLRLINAATKDEVKGAAKLLSGEFGALLKTLRKDMMVGLARLEAAIDFPDDVDEVEQGTQGIGSMLDKAQKIEKSIRKDSQLEHDIVLAGRPNVGKSSLMNALAERKISIVTREPGTTRDAIHTMILLNGLRINIVDTAGLMLRELSSEAERESELVAKEKIKDASVLLWVMDFSEGDFEKQKSMLPLPVQPTMYIVNKVDLARSDQVEHVHSIQDEGKMMFVSAKTGQGLEKLKMKISDTLIEEYGPASGIPVSMRQKDMICRVKESLEQAGQRMRAKQIELAAEDLKAAITETNCILGESLEAEDILDVIFSEFCIGK